MNRLRGRVGHMGIGSVQLLASSAIGAVLGYGFWMLLARSAEARVVGESSAVVAAASLVSVVVVAGMVPSLAVGLSRSGRHPALLHSALALGGGAAAVIATVVIAVSWSIGTLTTLHAAPGTAAAFVAAATALALGFLLDAAHTAARGTRRVLLRTGTTAALRIAALGAVLSIGKGLPTSAVLALWSGALWVGVVPSYLAARAGSPSRPSREGVRELLSSFGWNHMGAIAGQAPTLLLPVLVTAVLGAEVNAWFYMGWQLAAGCHMVAAAVAPVLLSEVARRETNAGTATRNAGKLTAGLGTVAALATVAAAPVVLAALGDTYQPALSVLLVMVAATAPDAVTTLAVARWRAEGREREAARLNALMAAVTVAGALVLLPPLGGVGAAWAFLAAQSLGAVLVTVQTARVQSSGRGSHHIENEPRPSCSSSGG